MLRNLGYRFLLPVLAAVGGGVIACGSAAKTPSEIPIWDITQSQLSDSLFPVDYGALVNQSLAGDREALISLIRLGQYTDAAGALGFGVLLQAIALQIGDENFAEACRELSDQEREFTHSLLEAGFDYGDEAYQVEDLPRQLPLTVEVLKP